MALSDWSVLWLDASPDGLPLRREVSECFFGDDGCVILSSRGLVRRLAISQTKKAPPFQDLSLRSQEIDSPILSSDSTKVRLSAGLLPPLRRTLGLVRPPFDGTVPLFLPSP